MKADIFIPTSNRQQSLKQCLDSLNAQPSKSFRIILVGIGNDPKINSLIKKYPKLSIKYIIQRNKGLVAAANDALRLAVNPIFVRLDDDVIVDKNWLKNLLDTYKTDKSIGGVTGPTVMTAAGLKSRDLTAFLEKFRKSKNPLQQLLFYIYNDVLYEGRMRDVSRFLESGVFTIGSNFKESLEIKELVDVNNLEACNWSARTALVKRIGGFDERYTKGLGDYHEADAAMKIEELGFRLVFNSKVNVIHNVEAAGVQAARPAAYHRIQNFIYFYFRFYKIKSPQQLGKFLLNLALQNAYFVYRFVSTGNLGQLGAIFGTMIGLFTVMLPSRRES